MYKFSHIFITIALFLPIFRTNTLQPDVTIHNNSNYKIYRAYQATGCVGSHSSPKDWGFKAHHRDYLCNRNFIEPGQTDTVKRESGQEAEKIFIVVNVKQDGTYPPYKQGGPYFEGFKDTIGETEFEHTIKKDNLDIKFPDNFTKFEAVKSALKYIPTLPVQQPLEKILYIGSINNQTSSNFALSKSSIRIFKQQTTDIEKPASDYATNNNVITLTDKIMNSKVILKLNPSEHLLTIMSTIPDPTKKGAVTETRYDQLQLGNLTNVNKLTPLIENLKQPKKIRGNTVVVTKWTLSLTIDRKKLAATIKNIELDVTFINGDSDTKNKEYKNQQNRKITLSSDWLKSNGILQEDVPAA